MIQNNDYDHHHHHFGSFLLLNVSFFLSFDCQSHSFGIFLFNFSLYLHIHSLCVYPTNFDFVIRFSVFTFQTTILFIRCCFNNQHHSDFQGSTQYRDDAGGLIMVLDHPPSSSFDQS